MKSFAHFLSFAVIFSTLPALAGIEHENCEISAHWKVVYPQIESNTASDWSSDGTIDGRFYDWGYLSKKASDIKSLPDGALFTNMVSLQYAKQISSSDVAWHTYTLIGVLKRDRKNKNGYVTLAKSSSSENDRYIQEDAASSMHRSVTEAISTLPRCRVLKK